MFFSLVLFLLKALYPFYVTLFIKFTPLNFVYQRALLLKKGAPMKTFLLGQWLFFKESHEYPTAYAALFALLLAGLSVQVLSADITLQLTLFSVLSLIYAWQVFLYNKKELAKEYPEFKEKAFISSKAFLTFASFVTLGIIYTNL